MLNSVDAKACFFLLLHGFLHGGVGKNGTESRSSRQVFFFLVQEKPVLVRITSEGPSKENRLEEII